MTKTKVIIQSKVAEDILSDMSRPIPLKALRKAMRMGRPRPAGQARPQRKGTAKAPLMHPQFTPAMQKALIPILANAVANGELDPIECGMIETQINKSIRYPLFRLDRKYLGFLNKKLKAEGWGV